MIIQEYVIHQLVKVMLIVLYRASFPKVQKFHSLHPMNVHLKLSRDSNHKVLPSVRSRRMFVCLVPVCSLVNHVNGCNSNSKTWWN
jgi:hypothetical protein